MIPPVTPTTYFNSGNNYVVYVKVENPHLDHITYTSGYPEATPGSDSGNGSDYPDYSNSESSSSSIINMFCSISIEGELSIKAVSSPFFVLFSSY